MAGFAVFFDAFFAASFSAAEAVVAPATMPNRPTHVHRQINRRIVVLLEMFVRVRYEGGAGSWAGNRILASSMNKCKNIDAFLGFSRNVSVPTANVSARSVREGNGGKDRMTTLPQVVSKPLQEHLQRVQAIHQQDLADGTVVGEAFAARPKFAPTGRTSDIEKLCNAPQ